VLSARPLTGVAEIRQLLDRFREAGPDASLLVDPELGTLPPRKLAALVGLAPFNHDSGCWQGQRRIKGGRADVRRVLYMATWACIRAKSPLATTYARLRAAGKPAKVAIVACMHKYLRWLNAIARDQAPYTPPAIACA